MQSVSQSDDGYRPRDAAFNEIFDLNDSIVAWLANTPSPGPTKRKRSPSPAVQRQRWTGGGGGPPGSGPPAGFTPVRSPSPIDVTLSEDEVADNDFDLAHWIASGQVWSEDLPRGVLKARDAARSVPFDELPFMLPDGKRTVSELLSQDLPTASNDTQPATFTRNAVSTQPSLDIMFSSVSFLSSLRSTFNNKWLAGVTSISFPHLPGMHFPLWTESLLGSVETFLGKRRRWEHAREWLDKSAEEVPADLLAACEDIIQILPWDAPVPGLSPAVHLTTQDVAHFLGPRWLNDDMINAGVDYILRRLEPGSRIRILNCLFIQSLANARARSQSYSPPTFSSIEKALRNGSALIVYLPLHVNGNHWTLLKVDLRNNNICVADSMRGGIPKAEIDLVKWWLASILSGSPSFNVVTPNIPSPRQQDGHSCGIIVLSILAAVLLNEEIWCPAHASRHRMEWFLRLTESFADEDDSYGYTLISNTSDCGTTPDTSDYISSHPSTPGSSSPPELAAQEDDVIVVEISDYMSSHPSTPAPSSSPSSPELATQDDDVVVEVVEVSMPEESVADEGLQLDDVDFFLGGPMDVDPQSLPLSPRPPPIEHAPSEYSFEREDSDTDSDESDHWRPRRRGAGGPKPGSSWDIQKQLVAASKLADFEANSTRLGTFRRKILRDDRNAEFSDDDVRRVRCSHCAQWIEMRMLYELARWKEHRETAKCIKNRERGLLTKSLFTLGFKKLPRATAVATVLQTPLPCPGLTRESNEEIATYLARTAVAGGGAPSRSRLALELFSTDCKGLNEKQHRMVLRRELALQKWKIARAVGAVFATTCLRDVPTMVGEEAKPCSECRGLYRLHGFQVAIHRPMPDEKAMKYVPVGYRDPDLGALFLKHKGLRELVELEDGRSHFLKFAQGCADGSYTSDTLTGMIQALVLKQSRLRSGKSLKNMKYPPEFDQFCDLLASTSPRAYATFQKTFGGRGTRSMRQVRAKLPKFAPGIVASNITRVVDVLVKLEYGGPLGLSCDDTALEQAISVYQETKNTCLILGSIDGVIRVNDDDDIDALLAEAQLKKADKLRVWVLSIPLPKIPPIMVAAVARGSSVKAVDLAAMHTQLLDLLNDYGIHPISLSSDGAEVERAASRIIAESTTSHLLYTILNSTPGCTLLLKIPLSFGHFPLIVTQDSKHALKTARNQIFTGARFIALGFFVVVYVMLRQIAMDIAGPLFTRDVEKVDKQDDRAAARMFSARTLEFQLKNYPGQTGLSVYLFVMGELIDAWQNRNITHQDRAKMVLRARFFLMAWRTHIVSHPDYSVSTQFISRESYDIFLIICDGLLGLIIAYRKYFPTYPLLPWLHSTEACEHLFGMVRQLKKDFTYADVLYLERKLRALQMGAFGGLSADQRANQVSAGYHHTYFKADDLDTATLLQYPTDVDMGNASEHGFAEAAQLLKLVGIDAKAMLAGYESPAAAAPKYAAQTKKSRPPQTLLELLTLYENVPLKSSKDQRDFEACQLALAAESLDKSLAIAALPDDTEASIEELRADIKTHLNIETPAVCLHLSSVPPALVTLPLVVDNTLNDLLLVSERSRHQTKSTSQAVRQHGRISTILVNGSGGISEEKGPSLRETLLKKLAAIVPASDTLNKTTGVDRHIRHAGTFGGTDERNVRTQNKATVQGVAASKFVGHRAQALVGHQGIHENMYSANINDFNSLKPGHIVVALNPVGTPPLHLVLGEVVTMYTKNTMHDWIPTVTSVGTPSYICIQGYASIAGPMFTSMSCPKLACGSFLQIPRTHLIFSFASFDSKITRQQIPTAGGHPHTLLTLCATSAALFETIQTHQLSLNTAVRELMRLSKARNNSSDTVQQQEIESEDSSED
ncbi:hypothetical protein C8F04DRAFT_958759 [Mycena alexandri]|uniref:Ubiquitin-like protease family profile domain-containing protein n=1 Tax=Mycena alexandri TaxID=1745969 RepID=A0AAD6SRH4_9AGAR|nr:hypothetical protein C8F04DRAFT_958759 [Mycena alexandri]